MMHLSRTSEKVFDNLQSLQTYNLQATTYNLQPRFIALENKQVWNIISKLLYWWTNHLQ